MSFRRQEKALRVMNYVDLLLLSFRPRELNYWRETLIDNIIEQAFLYEQLNKQRDSIGAH